MVDECIQLPGAIPVMVLRESYLFPHCVLPLYIFEARYRQMVKFALENDRHFCIGVIGDHDPETDESIRPITTAGMIRACVKQPDGTSHLILQGIHRVRITDWTQRSPFRIARIEIVEDDLTGDEDRMFDLVDEIVEVSDQLITEDSSLITRSLHNHLTTLEDPVTLADILSHNLVQCPQRRRELLEEPSLMARLESLALHLRQQVADKPDQ